MTGQSLNHHREPTYACAELRNMNLVLVLSTVLHLVVRTMNLVTLPENLNYLMKRVWVSENLFCCWVCFWFFGYVLFCLLDFTTTERDIL